MTDSTQQKIQQVLSDLIDRYGLVFWYDEGGHMQLFADSLDIPGVKVLTLQNKQQTRAKLISLITTKMQFVLNGDTAELRGYEREIGELRKQIAEKTEKIVIEEVAYTWFNRVMALRFMDANGYNAPMVVTPAEGQTRPEILQDAMGRNQK